MMNGACCGSSGQRGERQTTCTLDAVHAETLPLSFGSRQCSFQCKAPEHPLCMLVKLVACSRNAPMTHVLPTPCAEFVEERNGVTRFDGGEQRPIRGRQMLIAVPACAGVDDRIRVVCGVAVGITGIDAAEVGQQRDEAALSLIDAVADAMRALHFGPRKNASKV